MIVRNSNYTLKQLKGRWKDRENMVSDNRRHHRKDQTIVNSKAK